MTIIRSARPQRDFTIISNSVCLDGRLSMRALGLLVRLLSRPDNWSTNSETLSREFDVGREQMQKVLRELAQAGYMKLVKTRSKDGTITSAWHVFDEPKTGEPESGKPAPGKPYAGEPVAFNKTDLTRTDNNIKAAPKGAEIAKLFDAFWNVYPKKVGKDAAYKAFAKRKPDEQLLKAMIEAIERQKRSEQWVDTKYIPNPATWLNQGRWMDEVETSIVNDNPFAGGI